MALGRTSRKVFWPHKSQSFFVGTFNAHTAHKSQSFCLAHFGSHTRARATPWPHRHTAPVMRARATDQTYNFGSQHARATPWPYAPHTTTVPHPTYPTLGRRRLPRTPHHTPRLAQSEKRARAQRRGLTATHRTSYARASHHQTYNFGSDHKLRLTHTKRTHACAGALLVPARAKFATCLRLRSHTSARTDAG